MTAYEVRAGDRYDRTNVFQNYGYSQYTDRLSLTSMDMAAALGSDAG
jgi:hypothetical protein